MAPGLPLSAGSGSGLEPPTPPPLGVILGPVNPSKSGLQKAEFFRFFGALRCNAQGGWGGSAHYPDPTAQSAPRAPRDDRRTAWAATRGHPGPFWVKKGEKFSFFLRTLCVCFEDEMGVAIACGDVAVGGRKRPPPPFAEVCDAKGGAYSGPVPLAGTL